MADPMMRCVVPSLPVTDASLPTVCAQIRDLIASAGSTSPHSFDERLDQLNVSIRTYHDITIHNSRTEVLQDPMVRASYLRACGKSKARANASGAFKSVHHEGFRAPPDELHTEAGLRASIKARSQPERSPELIEMRDSWKKARDLKRKTRGLKKKAQDSKKRSNMSIYLFVRLMHDLERVGADLVQSDLFDSCPMLSNSVADLSRFPGDVIINGNAEMARLSALAGDAASRSDAVSVEPELSVRHVAFWTDASCPIPKSGDDDDRGCGIGVIYRPPRMQSGDDEWITEGYRISILVDVACAEALAVLWALMIAKKHYKTRSAGSEERRFVLIFTDSRDVLRRIQDINSKRSHMDTVEVPVELIMRIRAEAQQLIEDGVHIELHWVPGHKGVPGNQLADEVAKQAAKAKHLSSKVTALERGKPVAFEREVRLLGDDAHDQ